MKTALLTDLHANREAVEAVLEHARGQGVHSYAFLGDLVGYGADPEWVLDIVRDKVDDGAIVVMGNHDQAVAMGSRPGMNPDAQYVIDWTRSQLRADQLEFLSALPMAAEHGETLYVHANAFAPAAWDYVHDRDTAMRSINATHHRITFCGHVHEPRLYHQSAVGKAGEFVPSPGVPIPLLTQRRWLGIPGSAGQPRDGNPAACYAVHDDQASTLTFWRVPYDHDGAAAKIRAASLPQRLASRLAEGH